MTSSEKQEQMAHVNLCSAGKYCNQGRPEVHVDMNFLLFALIVGVLSVSVLIFAEEVGALPAPSPLFRATDEDEEEEEEDEAGEK